MAAVHSASAQGLAAPQARDAQQTRELHEVRGLVQRGELERAERQVDAYLAAHPRDPRGRFLKGVVLAERNRTEEAIAVYTRLVEDHPELPEPYNNLAALYALKGDYEAARDALERAVRAQPSYATAHENLGDVYARLAALAYGRAVELDRGRTSAQQKLKTVTELVPPVAAAPQGR